MQIYPSALVNASRMMKLAASVAGTHLFEAVHLVGVRSARMPEVEPLGERAAIVRFRGTDRLGVAGQLLRFVLWQPRVYRRYRRAHIGLIAAHNVWVLPLCFLLSRTTRAPLVYNAHELETETSTMHGAKQQLARAIERKIIPHCSLVTVVSEPIAGWYSRSYAIDRPLVVRNIPEDASGRVDDLRDLLGITQDDMLYIHTGHLSDGRSIPLILDAFADSPHHVVFVGDGPHRSAVESAAALRPNIHWLPPVPPGDVVAYVRQADVALCLIEADEHLSLAYSAPNKLFEALLAGVPPLSSDLVVARSLLSTQAPSWVLKDPEHELAGALERIGKPDVEGFRAAWTGLGSWQEEVTPVLVAYRHLVDRSNKP